MNIIIFGATGRLGTALCRHLTGHNLKLPATEDFASADGPELVRMIRESGAEMAVNTAAYNNVNGAEGDGYETCRRANAEFPGLLADAAATVGIPLIHFSTNYVFSGEKGSPYVESDVPDPVSRYGQAKADGERLVRENHPEGSFVIRTSRLFGPPGTAPESKRSFVEIIVGELSEQAASPDPKPVLVDDREVCSPTFIDDLAEAVTRHFIGAQQPVGIYHLTNSGSCTWFGWAEEIARLSGLGVPVAPRPLSEIKPRPARVPPYSVLESTRLPALRPWPEALRDYMSKYGK
ncbi:NAD(P)-dependent oxidoreductase [Candidatus Uhrbacteria bacterium]|nr:NAD(P)-dependent oxidoreductase [Candidatus Uhrbacteria bacterium]